MTHSAAKSTPPNIKKVLREFVSIRQKYGGSFFVPWFYIDKICLTQMKQLFLIRPLKKLYIWDTLTHIRRNMKYKKELERYEKSYIDSADKL
jgi:hypothetical protein